MEACEITNTICQLQEGSLLGAVKLENILPWERDCDIAVLSSHFSNLTDYLEKNPIGKLKISKSYYLTSCSGSDKQFIILIDKKDIDSKILIYLR